MNGLEKYIHDYFVQGARAAAARAVAPYRVGDRLANEVSGAGFYWYLNLQDKPVFDDEIITEAARDYATNHPVVVAQRII